MIFRRYLPILAVASLLSPNVALPCAPAPAYGERVNVSRENALIVWDEAQHIEHFVRNATFDTAAESFGFLVPTPAKPELAEARDAVFGTLARMTSASTVHESAWSPLFVGCTSLPFQMLKSGATRSAIATAPPVTVVDEARVAGLDAVVLSATDAGALAAWLHGHGFEMRDALQRWLSVYVTKKWMITAFRYTRSKNPAEAPDRVGASAVRLSFATDAPVYPYLEPDDTAAVPGRELHLFVASSHRVEGAFVDDHDRPWAAAADFSGGVDVTDALASTLPGVALPAHLWLDERTDVSTKRVASDVAFHRAPSDVEVHRPPIVIYDEHRIPIPYEVPFLIGGIVYFVRRRKRGRALAR